MTSPGLVDVARISRLEASTGRSRPCASAGGVAAEPHIIDFALNYVGVALYPRQATLLKVMFCELELLTDYDHAVIEQWASGFHLEAQSDGSIRYIGSHGICPDVLDRMARLRSSDRRWFREAIVVAGRRGSKGLLGAICTAYILWRMIHGGDPQQDLGLPRGKQLHVLVFAGQHQQAHENQFRDIAELIRGAPCFQPYLGPTSSDSICLYSAAQRRGSVDSAVLPAFVISAREATTNSGRGQASLIQLYDEMAHMNASGANRSAAEIYSAASPGTAQFPDLALLYQASSPWSKTGKFYAQYQRGLAVDPATGRALDPDMLVVQLPSPDLYRDWEQTQDSEFLAWPGGPPFVVKSSAIFDDGQEARQRRAEPLTYDVEYRAQWAASEAAYLPRVDVDVMFAPFQGRELEMQNQGTGAHSYIAHGDPSVSGANFGFAIAHAERLGDRKHVVVDFIHVWRPIDFDDHRIDYEVVTETIKDLMTRFRLDTLTFDQFQSAGLLSSLKSYARSSEAVLGSPRIWERTATASRNFRTAETFKNALGRGLIHAPRHELAEAELRALELRNGRVDHPTTGHIRTKDIADCLMAVTDLLIGDRNGAQLHQDLGAVTLSGAPMPALHRQMGLVHASQSPAAQARGSGTNRARGRHP